MAEKRSATFLFAVGRNIGMGHLRRSEALAVELVSRGWEVCGVAHGAEPDETLPAHVKVSPDFRVLEQGYCLPPDLTVYDSYLVSAEEKKVGVSEEEKVFSFMDSPAADASDLVADVNVGADTVAYAAAGCAGRVLAGPDYFPVRPTLPYLATEAREKDRSGAAARLLVTFGGSDWHGLAERATRELAAASCDLQVRVAAGDLGGKTPALQEALAALPRAELIPPGSELAEHFAWADLALGAAGLTKYELALFGVPAIIVAIAENQAVGAKEFAARGSALYLGRAEELAPGALARAVNDLALDSQTRAELSAAGKKLVDGRGAARIANEIERLMEGTP